MKRRRFGLNVSRMPSTRLSARSDPPQRQRHELHADGPVRGGHLPPGGRRHLRRGRRHGEGPVPHLVGRHLSALARPTQWLADPSASFHLFRNSFCSKGKKVCQGQPCVKISPTTTTTTTTTMTTTTPPTPTTPTTTPAPPSEPATVVVTTGCRSGWSRWFNSHQPQPGGASMDVEPLPTDMVRRLLFLFVFSCLSASGQRCLDVSSVLPRRAATSWPRATRP